MILTWTPHQGVILQYLFKFVCCHLTLSADNFSSSCGKTASPQCDAHTTLLYKIFLFFLP